MLRTCGQKSPFTSRTNPPTLRSASSARQRSSCSVYGYMQADVLPVPTAPRIMTPVYNPRCGIVSHVGDGAGPVVVAKCASPNTSVGDGRSSGRGYGGRGRRRTVGADPDTTIASSDVNNDASTKGGAN